MTCPPAGSASREAGLRPRIGAIASWAGSKRLLAQQIVAEFGPHRGYFEPFCGSLAVFLAKRRCCVETVNDVHGDLIHLARTIQCPTAGSWLYRKLRRTLYCQDLFAESATVVRDEPFAPTPERAYHYFVYSWQGRQGVGGTSNQPWSFSAGYAANGMHGPVRFAAAVDSIPAWRRRLRHVAILNEDAFELLAKIEDSRDVCIYADPPYIAKGVKYRHDFGVSDHERLAVILRRFTQARVVLSYREHQSLAELYDGWSVRHVGGWKRLRGETSIDGTADGADEVLLINGPSLEAGRLF